MDKGSNEGRAQCLSGEQVELVASRLEENGGALGLRNATIWRLGVATMFRVREILGLRVRDVWVDSPDFRGPRSQIVIGRARTKTKKSRTVEIGADTQAVITRYMLSRGGVLPGGPLFPSSQHPDTALCYRQFERELKRIGDSMGMSHLRSHSMRRSGANLSRRVGADLRQIQEQLGHSSTRTTDIYLGTSPEELRAVNERRAAHLRECRERLSSLSPLPSAADS